MSCPDSSPTRFVRLFRYDPAKDPCARLRLDYDPDFGNAILADENTLPEESNNPDTNRIETLASMQLTTACVRWLHEASGELLAQMEDAERTKL